MVATSVRMTAAQRRQQLLDVARDVVDEHGFHAVSIEAVARGAGITRPVVYGHFDDLGGLLHALVEREGARALAQLGAVMARREGGGEPPEILLATLRAYLEAVRDDPVTWRLVLMPPEGAPAILRERIAAARGAVVAQLGEIVGPGLGAAGASPDAELTARALSAVADESARLVLTDPAAYPVDRLVAHAAWVLEQFG